MRRLFLACTFLATSLFCAVPGSTPEALGLESAQSAVVVSARPVNFSTEDRGSRYGKLEWRGGLQLSSTDPRFGGFSAMTVSADGQKLLAVSDDGWWLRLAVRYDEAGRLAGVGDGEMAAILDANGQPYDRKGKRDAEALTALSPAGPDGPVAVGFENRVRIERYNIGENGLAARPEPLFPSLPERLRKGPGNQELEALAWIPSGGLKGRLLAISENNLDSRGNIRAWVLGGAKPISLSFEKNDTFRITDVTILPSGDIVTVERDFSRSDRRLRMGIRRFPMAAVKEGATLRGEVLLIADWPRDTIDNMEAIASYRAKDGEERLLIMSDDNYNGFLQRTLLLQFALPGKAQ